MYLEENGYNNLDELYAKYDDQRKRLTTTRKALKDSETVIKGLNEQIHYTGQYLANKAVYQEFLKAKNKGLYRKLHESEIMLYEAARGWLKSHAEDGSMPSYALLNHTPGKIPNLHQVKAKRDELIREQKSIRADYKSARVKELELGTIVKNMDTILGRDDHSLTRRSHRDEVL